MHALAVPVPASRCRRVQSALCGTSQPGSAAGDGPYTSSVLFGSRASDGLHFMGFFFPPCGSLTLWCSQTARAPLGLLWLPRAVTSSCSTCGRGAGGSAAPVSPGDEDLPHVPRRKHQRREQAEGGGEAGGEAVQQVGGHQREPAAARGPAPAAQLCQED